MIDIDAYKQDLQAAPSTIAEAEVNAERHNSVSCVSTAGKSSATIIR
jgi:hypothetical protein